MPSRRDWSKYNKERINRGKINFWIKPSTQWKAPKRKKNGHPFVYADEAIKAMLYIRFKYHLSLRELEGFFISLMKISRETKKVPCYTQVYRRMKNLSLPQKLLEKKGVTDIVLDTTGLKIYGAGEWRAKRYGGKARWRKLHLAMDYKTGKLTLAEITDEYKHDTTYLEKALKESNGKKGKILIDGIGDSRKCYELAQRHNKVILLKTVDIILLAFSSPLRTQMDFYTQALNALVFYCSKSLHIQTPPVGLLVSLQTDFYLS